MNEYYQACASDLAARRLAQTHLQPPDTDDQEQHRSSISPAPAPCRGSAPDFTTHSWEQSRSPVARTIERISAQDHGALIVAASALVVTWAGDGVWSSVPPNDGESLR
ncbi:hypothetical protein LUX12_21470 [Streptomyces somaliensis]|uniref:hypothetical protein n=1 Tax=Streptomyces somaliensis TaxID=78355 RepID=UPI0020CC36A2|nr:hypothetical protein [Streptomyces somaliensis]MCP9946782.1 hypothetical protein [Streptomyces somaliensis]